MFEQQGIAADRMTRVVAMAVPEADGLTVAVLALLGEPGEGVPNVLVLTLAEVVQDAHGNWYAVATWA